MQYSNVLWIGDRIHFPILEIPQVSGTFRPSSCNTDLSLPPSLSHCLLRASRSSRSLLTLLVIPVTRHLSIDSTLPVTKRYWQSVSVDDNLLYRLCILYDATVHAHLADARLNSRH
jgi:hypothetical protein